MNVCKFADLILAKPKFSPRYKLLQREQYGPKPSAEDYYKVQQEEQFGKPKKKLTKQQRLKQAEEADKTDNWKIEDQKLTRVDWVFAVKQGDTQKGYWQWVVQEIKHPTKVELPEEDDDDEFEDDE